MSDTQHLCYSCMRQVSPQATICPHCRSTIPYVEPNSRLLQPGVTLQNGRYTIGRCIGAGGFGATYIAVDNTQNSLRVAIKEFLSVNVCARQVNSSNVLPNPGQEDLFREFLEKFFDEAKRLQSLILVPGVVKCTEYFRENGTGYFVMEYLEGSTLKDYLKRQGRPFSTGDALHMTQRVLDILHGVHERNILHRDVAADNIFHRNSGELVLIDFGSARSDAANTSHTKFLKGNYTAPEQQSGMPENAYTDVYSTGVLLFVLLNGREPQKQNGVLEPLPRHFPKELQDIYAKATKHNPTERYQTAYEMRLDITALLQSGANGGGGGDGGGGGSGGGGGGGRKMVWVLLIGMFALLAVVLVLLLSSGVVSKKTYPIMVYYVMQDDQQVDRELYKEPYEFPKGEHTVRANPSLSQDAGMRLVGDVDLSFTVLNDGKTNPERLVFYYEALATPTPTPTVTPTASPTPTPTPSPTPTSTPTPTPSPTPTSTPTPTPSPTPTPTPSPTPTSTVTSTPTASPTPTPTPSPTPTASPTPTITPTPTLSPTPSPTPTPTPTMVPVDQFVVGIDINRPEALFILSDGVGVPVDAMVANVFPATLYIEAELDNVQALVLEHVASGTGILLDSLLQVEDDGLHRTMLYLSPGEYRVLANLADPTNEVSKTELYANEGMAVEMDASLNEAHFAFSIMTVDAGPYRAYAGEAVWVPWQGTPLLFTPITLNNIIEVFHGEDGMLVTVGKAGDASLTFSDGIARHEVLFQVDSLAFRTKEEAYTLAAGDQELVLFETLDEQPLQASAMKLDIPDGLLAIPQEEGLLVGSTIPGTYVLTANYAGGQADVSIIVEDRFISLPALPTSLSVGQSITIPLSTYSGGVDNITVNVQGDDKGIIETMVDQDGLTVTGLARGSAELTIACMGAGFSHDFSVTGGFIQSPVLPDAVYIGRERIVDVAVHGSPTDVQVFSSDESVLHAMMDNDGLHLFPVSLGSAQVALSYQGDHYTYDLTVSPVLLGVTPQKVEVQEEDSFTLSLEMTEGQQVPYAIDQLPDILRVASKEADTVSFLALAPGSGVITIDDGSGQLLEVPVNVKAEWRISAQRQQSADENNALHMALLREPAWGLKGPPQGIVTQDAQKALMKAKAAFGWDVALPYLTRDEYEILLAYQPEAVTSQVQQTTSQAPEGEAQIVSGVALGDTYYLLDSQRRLLIVQAGNDYASRVVNDRFVKVVSNGSLVLALSTEGFIYPFGPEEVIDRWFDELAFDVVTITGMDLPVSDVSFSDNSLVMVFGQDGEIIEKNKLKEVVAGQACIYLQTDRAGNRGVVLLASVEDALMMQGGGTRHVLFGLGSRNNDALYEITDRKTTLSTLKAPTDMDLHTIAVSSDMTVLVDSDGTAYLRGKNAFGQIGNGTTRQSNNFVAAEGVSDVVHAALGDTYALLLTGGGRLYVAGQVPTGEQFTSFTLIAQDIRHMMPLEDGRVLLVNDAHQITVTNLSNISNFRSIYYP
ncbi:MAG: protein kinase domain-containing protein [Christensenellales bacterium]